MIDIFEEQVVTLSEAARSLPRRARGKNPHVSTVYRWVNRGVRGVHLESVQVGGILYTSFEAIRRFLVRLNPDDEPQDRSPDRKRKQSIERDEAELDRIGIGTPDRKRVRRGPREQGGHG